MKKTFYLLMIVLFTVSQASPVFTQEGVIGGAEVSETNMTAHIEKISYVKPGNVTVNFKDADIKAVLNYLAEVSGVDIVTAPDVTGNVTLKLTDKPWETALKIIVKNYGYAYEREGDIIRVVTLDSLKKAELSTEVIHLNYATVDEAKIAVTDMLSDRGKVAFDARTNTVLVTDLPTNIYKIKQVMTKIDKRTPQVMIEARIFETLLEDDERMGIDWGLKIALTGAARPTTLPFLSSGGLQFIDGAVSSKYLPVGLPASTTSTTPSGGGAAVETTSDAEFPSDGVTPFPYVDADQFTYGTLDFTQFSAVLELLKQRRSTDVISNPRITTLNHKEAKILVGRVYNFPTFDQTELTGQWVISGYESKELGIKLVVVPHVNKNGEIVVELKPEISNYLGLEKISDELSAPIWSTRMADTQIMARDGDTIFIGGLVSENNVDVEKKVPVLGDILGDIPFIGGLVKHTSVEKEKKELIFFITVHIVKDAQRLTKIAMRNISEIKLPEDMEIIEEEKEVIEKPKEVFVELPAKESVTKKKHKPLFDFRKKKEI